MTTRYLKGLMVTVFLENVFEVTDFVFVCFLDGLDLNVTTLVVWPWFRA